MCEMAFGAFDFTRCEDAAFLCRKQIVSRIGNHNGDAQLTIQFLAKRNGGIGAAVWTAHVGINQTAPVRIQRKASRWCLDIACLFDQGGDLGCAAF